MLSVSIDSFHFYFLAAALQGFVLSFIIFFQKPGKNPGLLLSILLFLSSLSLLHGVLEESIHAFNTKFLVPMEFGFAIGPIAYFHFKEIVNPSFKLSLRLISHLIPSFLIDILFSTSFFTYVRFNMDWAYANVENIQLVFLLIGLLVFFHMLIYAYFIYRMTRKRDFKSLEIEKKITGWLKTFGILWILNLTFIGIVIPVAILNLGQLDDHLYMVYKPAGVLGSICIYWLGYSYLLKYRSSINNYLLRMSNTRYSPAEVTKRKKQLVEALEVEALYKNEKLNVEGLARHLGWSMRDVSQIIREGFGTNFNELINRYRIDAFKVMITVPENRKYSIAGIAKDVGFNSKASFYRAFKKTCGETPMEFLNNATSE